MFAEGGEQGAVDTAGVAEADLGFLGVDVDVEEGGVHFDGDDGHGLRGGLDEAAIGFLEVVEEGAVTDEAAVEEDVLVAGGGAGEGRLAGEAVDADAALFEA